MSAINQIRQTPGLDYAGVDFGMNERDWVFLFEANAVIVAASFGGNAIFPLPFRPELVRVPVRF